MERPGEVNKTADGDGKIKKPGDDRRALCLMTNAPKGVLPDGAPSGDPGPASHGLSGLVD
ncbi:hypothetical protein GCM10007285_12460 [Stappia taiwanensis]|nr:hypothetical protein GCM10007285_12460 [Stappia taiwanensis]